MKDSSSSEQGDCIDDLFKGQRWVDLMVYVEINGAEISVDGKTIITIKNVFPITARGGVIAKNGENNIVRFKNYTIQAWNYS